MAACNPDVISLCHTVDMVEGINRAGKNFAYQGNMDAGVLFGSKDVIEQRVHETIRSAQQAGVRHVMNLGHGIQQVRDFELFRINISNKALLQECAPHILELILIHF